MGCVELKTFELHCDGFQCEDQVLFTTHHHYMERQVCLPDIESLPEGWVRSWKSMDGFHVYRYDPGFHEGEALFFCDACSKDHIGKDDE